MRNLILVLVALVAASLAQVAVAQQLPGMATITGCVNFGTSQTVAANGYAVTNCDAQGNLRSAPAAGTTTMAGGTIAVTNTFQQALAASATRKGCTLQNNDTNVMLVFFGTIGSASLTNSFKLAAGQAMSCNVGNVVLTDAVNVTGTATGAFVISNQ